MPSRLKWILIAAALLLVALAWYLDHRTAFPPLLRNQGITA